jgi:molecular chaperone GrpE (heat shock protein)
MLKWLKENFSFGPLTSERRTAIQREAQRLQQEVEEQERKLAALQDALERYVSAESARTAEAVRAQAERLMTVLAAPVAQLLTQAHRLEVEGQPVQAADVLVVAKQMVRALEDEGLKPEGRVGEATDFDPHRHEALGGGALLTPGQPVVVCFVGVSYHGKLLRKAGVAERE